MIILESQISLLRGGLILEVFVGEPVGIGFQFDESWLFLFGSQFLERVIELIIQLSIGDSVVVL